jgi:hypothetical protein
MMLLVQVAKHQSNCEHLIERVGTGGPDVFTEADRDGINRSKLLDDVVLPVLPVPALRDSPQSHASPPVSQFSATAVPQELDDKD